MLSVFITPCTKPTRIQCTTSSAVRRAHLGEQAHVGRPGPGLAELAGSACAPCSAAAARAASCSSRAASSSKLPKRRNEGATRHTTAPGSGAGMSVVQDVAHHLLAGGHQAERARGGHAQMKHRLAAQKLAQRRAQHRAPVGGARVRRGARALELKLPALTPRVDDLAQGDGATIAELPRPVAELMSAVAGGVRLHAGQQAIAREHLGERIALGDGRRRGRAAQHLPRVGHADAARAPWSGRRA